MSTHNSSRSDPNPLKSGLTKELDKLGRTRGSSGTPAPTAIVSPTPQRGIQKQIARMNVVAATGRDDQDLSPASNRSVATISRTNQSQAHGQVQSPRSTSSSGMGISSQRSSRQYNGGRDVSPSTATFKFPTQNQQQYHGGDSSAASNSMTQFSTYFQTRLIELKQTIKEAPGIPSQTQEKLSAIVNNIGQEFNNRQRPVQLTFDTARNDQVNAQSQLDKMEARLLAANLDRDQAYAQVTELRLKKQKSIERLTQVTQDLRQINEDLLKQVEFQEEQLKGKRALWMEKNPGSSARRSAMNAAIRDPFSSPSAGMGSGVQKGKGKNKGNFAGMMGPMGSIGSPTASTAGSITGSVKGGSFGKTNTPSLPFNTAFNASVENTSLASQTPFESPPVNQTPVAGRLRRRGALPTGNLTQLAHAQSQVTRESILNSLASLPKNTEPGSPEALQSRALVLHSSNVTAGADDPGPKYESKFTQLYELAEDWCKRYASIPNLENDQAIARSNDVLWAYMMNCTYPGHRQDSHVHVMSLLQDPKCRYLFTMRMAVNYCIRDIMTLEEFETFSPEIEATLTQCKKALLARGLANEVRQSIIDRQSKAIEEITKHESFAEFRSSRLNHHTKQLRDMLGPLLNNHISRSDAGKQLGRLAAKAFDICTSLHTSFLTFQVYFPETSTKFNAATMVAKDQAGMDPMQLQLAQIRLKLVITPVVTMRDDRGTTIRAKNLHKAHVLTMT